MMTTTLVFLFLSWLAEMRNACTPEINIGKRKASGKQLRSGGWICVDSGQARVDRRKMEGQNRTQSDNLGDRLIEYVRCRLFIGNLRLRGFRQLIAATGSGSDGAVGEEEFGREQLDFAAGPENVVADAVGKINFASFVRANQTSATIVETDEVTPYYIVARGVLLEIRHIAHAARNHRVRICLLTCGRNPHGVSMRHQGQIISDITPRPERFRQEI